MRISRHLTALLLALSLPWTIPTGTARAEDPPACTFGPGDLPITTNPSGLHGNQIPIDHIVVLMQENRSFDHYFAKLHSVQRDVEALPRDASNPDPLGGPPIKPFHQKRLCEVADLSHSWNGSHYSWNDGAMDGFTARNVDPADPSGSRAMGYYTRRDLPWYYKVYSTFAISDRHFCSLLGPTHPNRHYLLAGTSFGLKSNQFPPSGGNEWSARTIFEQLDDAGVTWKIYYSDLPLAFLYGYVRNFGGTRVVNVSQYFVDAAAGTLPQVSFIDPSFFGETENDEHPPSNAQKGQKFVSEVVDALFASPQWPSSALFVTYDEHGGYWDHVPPPLACEPDATLPILSPTDYQARFDRYGVRVPFVAISPFSRKRYVSHTPTDQTSVLRFIQTRFDLPALTRRDANADPLLEMFDFAAPPFIKPPRLPKATVDPKRDALCP